MHGLLPKSVSGESSRSRAYANTQNYSQLTDEKPSLQHIAVAFCAQGLTLWTRRGRAERRVWLMHSWRLVSSLLNNETLGDDQLRGKLMNSYEAVFAFRVTSWKTLLVSRLPVLGQSHCACQVTSALRRAPRATLSCKALLQHHCCLCSLQAFIGTSPVFSDDFSS